MKLLTLATTRQKLLIAAALLVALALIAADAGLIRAQDTEANVCPPGSVKYEADNGYEYGADLATVVLAGPRAEWQALTDAGNITRVCLKAGTTLYWPATGPRNGAFDAPDGKDVSHVVLYLESPTAVEITDITAARASGWFVTDEEDAAAAMRDTRSAILALIAFSALALVISLIADNRRRGRPQ